MRALLVLVHRYVGLVLALFLVIAGLTGSVLAFYQELDAALNPGLLRATPPTAGADRIEPLRLREIVARQHPELRVHHVSLATPEGLAEVFHLEPPPGEAGSAPAAPEVFVNPYTGEIQGTRIWGDLAEGRRNVLPFIYRLHYSLALGTLGVWLLGIVALLWTVDCFVGAALTFPRSAIPPGRPRGRPTEAMGRWLQAWAPAWLIRWSGAPFKVVFAAHRAVGLWLWAMLFVFAWSGVAFNLSPVYQPLMRSLLAHQPREGLAPLLPQLQSHPGMTWEDALDRGRALMAETAAGRGIRILRDEDLSYDPWRGVFRYRALTSHDIRENMGATAVWFDANSGSPQGIYLPSGGAAGDTVTNWLMALHMGNVGGWPYRVFVGFLGMVVPGLALTGVWLWWRKARARKQTRGPAFRPSRPLAGAAHQHHHQR